MKKTLLEKLILEMVKEILSEAQPPPVPKTSVGPLNLPTNQPHNQAGLPRPIPPPPPKAFGLQQTSGPVTSPVAQVLLKMFGQTLKQKKGIDVSSLTQLGVGTQGVAYGFGDKVLKITGDKREVSAANLLKEKPLNGVVRYFDAWTFPNTEFFGIVLERIQPLSNKESENLLEMLTKTSFIAFLYKNGGDWNAAMKHMASHRMKEFVEMAFQKFPDAKNGKHIDDPRVQNFIKPLVNDLIQSYESLNKEYKLRELFKNLNSLGVEFYDFHPGNYGRRSDGSLVLVDVSGRIKSGLNKPPTL